MMKNKRLVTFLFLLVFGLGMAAALWGMADAAPVQAASDDVVTTVFTLLRHTFGNGGGTVSGSTMTLKGTFGQPGPVGSIQGSTFALQAGFWSTSQPGGVTNHTVYIPLVIR